MTAKKDFKRLVRARAKKTGESYAAALWHFQKEAAKERHMAHPTDPARLGLRRVEKPALGFALRIPDNWQEEPPDPFNSPDEVASFRDPATPGEGRGGGGGGTRNCRVFRSALSPVSWVVLRAGGLVRPGLDAKVVARRNQMRLARRQFRNFRLRDAVVAGRAAARLDCDRTYPGRGVWTVREYFVVAGEHSFCLAFGTIAGERDAALIDTLAARFELIERDAPAPVLSGRPDGTGAGGTAAGERRPPGDPWERRRNIRIDSKTRRRFAPYSARARQVVLAAHEEATKRNRFAIEQEDLLLGIATVSGTAALAVLETLGVAPARLRAATEAALSGAVPAPIQTAVDGASDRLRVTARTEAALALAEEEARARKHSIVGVEDLLLAMLRQGDGRGYDVLDALGVSLESARAALRSVDSAPVTRPPAADRP